MEQNAKLGTEKNNTSNRKKNKLGTEVELGTEIKTWTAGSQETAGSQVIISRFFYMHVTCTRHHRTWISYFANSVVRGCMKSTNFVPGVGGMLAKTIQLHVLQLPLSNFRVLTRSAWLDRLVQNDHVPLNRFRSLKNDERQSLSLRARNKKCKTGGVTINIGLMRQKDESTDEEEIIRGKSLNGCCRTAQRKSV